MPITYNLEEDIRFIQGEELGLKKGEKLGLKKGEEQTEEEMIAITAQLVSEDFRSGKITLEDIALRLKVPMARVEKMHRVIYPDSAAS